MGSQDVSESGGENAVVRGRVVSKTDSQVVELPNKMGFCRFAPGNRPGGVDHFRIVAAWLAALGDFCHSLAYLIAELALQRLSDRLARSPAKFVPPPFNAAALSDLPPAADSRPPDIEASMLV